MNLNLPDLEEAVFIVVTAVLTGWVTAWSQHALRGFRPRRGTWHTGELGLLERLIFALGVYLDRTLLIGAWLAFKAVGGWKAWGTEPGVFNRYAVGTAMNLFYGAAIGLSARRLASGDELIDSVSPVLSVLLLNGLIIVLHLVPRPLRFAWDPEQVARARRVERWRKRRAARLARTASWPLQGRRIRRSGP